MFAYDFMRIAFAAAGVVALLSGVVGFFLVLRGQTFAGHALSHVGFTGATGAVLFGLPPLWGLVGFTMLAGFAMGMLGDKLSGRDVAIGMTLSLALGLGLLFLHFYTAYASQAAALLFGNVLGVSDASLSTLAALSVVALGALAQLFPGRSVREPATRTGRGQGRSHALHLDRLPGHRGGRGRRMRADRGRPARLHADGRAGGGGAKTDDACWQWRGFGGRLRSGRGLGRIIPGLSDRLADEFLDHGAVRRDLFRQPRGGAVVARDGGTKSCGASLKKPCYDIT